MNAVQHVPISQAQQLPQVNKPIQFRILKIETIFEYQNFPSKKKHFSNIVINIVSHFISTFPANTSYSTTTTGKYRSSKIQFFISLNFSVFFSIVW